MVVNMIVGAFGLLVIGALSALAANADSRSSSRDGHSHSSLWAQMRISKGTQSR
jgi:hypothetical protein